MAKKRKKKAYWIIFVFLLVVAIAVGLIFFRTEILRFFKADVISKDFGVKSSIPISTGSIAASENENIYIYADNGISVYKDSGEFLRSYLLSYSDTQITFSKTHVIAYDKGATSYTVFSDGKKVNEYNAKTPITYVFAFDEYMFLLCEGAAGYEGAVYCSSYQTDVVIPDGYKNEIQYSVKYPIYIDMFDDEDKFVTVCCNPDYMSKTYIEVFEIGKSTPVSGITLEEFLPKIVCLEKGAFLAVNDNKMIKIDNKMSKTTILEDSTITYISRYDNNAYGYAIIDDEVQIFKVDSENGIDWSKEVLSDSSGFLSAEKKIIIWQGQSLSMFTLNGNDFHTIQADSQIQQVLAIGNKKLVIITPRNAVIYKY